jgi:hypothetical protein
MEDKETTTVKALVPFQVWIDVEIELDGCAELDALERAKKAIVEEGAFFLDMQGEQLEITFQPNEHPGIQGCRILSAVCPGIGDGLGREFNIDHADVDNAIEDIAG